jgi:hypothetical protein
MRYKKDFGTTIAGFFSDEPELGNGVMYQEQNILGTDQDLPWSMELQEQLINALGVNWRLSLPLLWNNEFSDDNKAYIRYIYMDLVTKLVEENFSKQIGSWCKERDVEYIGHIIEDNNQHARTGSSLGHFFRGLSGQHMSGIDNIGGQVLPQGEDLITKNIFGCIRDGEFYHYALAKLGSSYAAIDPKKNGRCMCEIFGNYGWKEGVRLEKYLVDHFMVRGVNQYVPHAFSPKKYPDRDCPPHFYNHGHDPLFRHFGALMKYTNRVCELISGGKGAEKIAILYHAEAEWAGNCMLMQKPARILAENQIDYNFIPIDVFANTEQYHTNFNGGLNINNKSFKLLIIPYMQFIPKVLYEVIHKVKNSGCDIIFIDDYPDGVIDKSQIIQTNFSEFEKISLDKLLYKVEALNLKEIKIQNEAKRLRCYHYINEGDIYFLVNEDDKLFSDTISIKKKGNPYEYDAWNNRLYQCEYEEKNEWLEFNITLAPSESKLIVFDKERVENLQESVKIEGNKINLFNVWKQRICKSIDYPVFTETKEIHDFISISEEKPRFSGFIQYENVITNKGYSKIILEITDAYEGVEVFINNVSAGIQIVPSYVYDITSLMKEGDNIIKIEVATTLERENCVRKSKLRNAGPTGITGEVNLYFS